jgi:hypothetical protein
MLWARRIRKPIFQNSGIEMIKGWESLQNELPGAENPKSRVPKTRRPESPEMPKMKVSKTLKLQSRMRAQKTYLNRNVFCSCSYWHINVVDCS